MTTANLRIVPYNLHDDATLTTTGATVATGFEAEHTQDSVRSSLVRTTSGSAFAIKGTLATSCKASAFGLFRHTAHGGTIRLRLFTDAAWSSSAYDSTALNADRFTTSATFGFGQSNTDYMKTNAPYSLFFTLTTFQSYQIDFGGTPTAGYWQACRAILGEHFEFAVNPSWGASIGFADNADRDRSRGGSLRTGGGEIWRTMQLDLAEIQESDRETVLDILEYLGTTRDCMTSLFPGDGTRLERDNTIWGKFANLNAIGRQVSYLTGRLQLEGC